MRLELLERIFDEAYALNIDRSGCWSTNRQHWNGPYQIGPCRLRSCDPWSFGILPQFDQTKDPGPTLLSAPNENLGRTIRVAGFQIYRNASAAILAG